jgi:hypothetical protein
VYADQQGRHALDLEAGILHIGQGRVIVLTSGVVQPKGVEGGARPSRGPAQGPLAR